MCDCCAATLKKNQVKRHYSECRGAKVFTCVDCSKDFSGQELDNHTSCKSEAEKYFGKFYEEKKKNSGTEKAKIIEKWRGWKNEIKYILKNAGADGIDQNKAKKQIIDRYILCHNKKEGLDHLYEIKSNFERFKKLDDRIYYYRYIKE